MRPDWDAMTSSAEYGAAMDEFEHPIDWDRAERIWDWSDDPRSFARRQEGAARYATAPFRPHVRRVSVERQAA